MDNKKNTVLDTLALYGKKTKDFLKDGIDKLVNKSPEKAVTYSNVFMALGVLGALYAFNKGDYPVIGFFGFVFMIALDSNQHAKKIIDERKQAENSKLDNK